MISQAAEYSLRAILCLARSNGKAITIRDLAQMAKAPREYFAKVLQTLVRAELVTSQRGLGGGFMLGRPVENLTLWDVVGSVDPGRKTDHHPEKSAGDDHALTLLHRRLQAATASMEQVLRNSTIAELIREADTASAELHNKEAAHD